MSMMLSSRMQQLSRSLEPLRQVLTVGNLVLLCALLIAALASLRAGPIILINTIVTGSMWALVAVGLTLVFGVMNISNFAQGAYFLLGSAGAYLAVGWLHRTAIPVIVIPVLAMAAGTAVGIVAGVLTDLAVFRPLRHRVTEHWVMSTFVVTIGISAVISNGYQLVLGPNYLAINSYWEGGLKIGGTFVSTDRIAVMAIGLVTIAALTLVLRFTSLGRAVRAVAQDEAGARMVGIKVEAAYVITLALSCGLASLAGAALLFLFPASPTVGDWPLQVSWTVVVLAGLGTVSGAVVAAFVVALATTITDYFIGTAWDSVVTMGLILAILAARPRGLFSRGVTGIWEGN
jgi:branched-chain amino acid transport system permease protein